MARTGGAQQREALTNVSSEQQNFELLHFDSPEALAHAAADELVGQIAGLDKKVEVYSIAVPGGRIVVKFYQAITQVVKSRSVSLERVHFFWGDERCVPPTDQESNFRLAKLHLFEPLAVPPSQIHRIRGEVQPAEAAKEATAELCRWVALTPAKQPEIDLVVLGLGENGHTASLFPEEPEEVRASPAIYRPVVASKPPPRRITLGYGALVAPRQVWVLASGSGKEEALGDSLNPGEQTPLGRVLGQRAWSKIFTDINLGASPF